MKNIKEVIKNNLPGSILRVVSFLLYPYHQFRSYKRERSYINHINKIRQQHQIALHSLQGKKHIRCVFLALFDSVWKYESVYRLMVNDTRFEPIILVCPIINHGEKNMHEKMEACYLYFQKKGYNVMKAYDCDTKKYVDLRKELYPDILFYTNPYKGLIDDRYYIDKYDDILTVYVSYNYGNSKDFNTFFNLKMHNYVWRYYAETEKHKSYAVSFAKNHGKNVVVTGYPGIEDFIAPDYISKDVWIDKTHKKKRIIWAPHHSIEPVGMVFYSCFLKYKDFMLAMAEKYQNDIEIFFKPHPLLKNKLYEFWGKEKTKHYYQLWAEGINTRLVDGEYTDLFLTSDAMIHDCGSFLIEYLYVNKPVMRTFNDEDPKEMYNEFALNCLNYYYKANNEHDIEVFIQSVINGVDPLEEDRTRFVNEVLMPKGGMPSENILNDIIDSIKNQRV